jgi:hypothetical protein
MLDGHNFFEVTLARSLLGGLGVSAVRHWDDRCPLIKQVIVLAILIRILLIKMTEHGFILCHQVIHCILCNGLKTFKFCTFAS